MKKIYIAAVLALSLAACNNKENLSSESVLKPRTTAKTALDTYIYNNFQQPYNIMVTYNYIDADFEMGKYFYPPTEAKVQPMLEIVKKVWIDSYTQVAGQNFIKSVAPRQISLIGGYNVNPSGTITLGFADSGMKITLFNVDQLDVTQHEATRQYFHTIQHEYCHIINPSDYTANWYNVGLADANKKGFITPYSMLNDIEDFAEMTSGMLSMSKTAWDAKINAIPEEGRKLIRKKEEFVVSYFKSEWNIDLYRLQEVVENQMLSVLQ